MSTGTVKKVVRVSKETSKWLEDEARNAGCAQSALIALIIVQYMRDTKNAKYGGEE